MTLLTALFRRPTRRHYALIDDQQRCRMLLTSTQRPHGELWFEVMEIRLGWIGQSLPQAALKPGVSLAP
ncbi:hypothetical protein CH92_04855 [Stutzerimonas stutzeri]|uniref:Uncharacterized protein n=1 Tax=Stutzerimonas stutzeri TaxID=316 RepID=W8R7Y0_STUST|nr:hypothetical protein [Stutzerimonas stutzeri]AHL74452.1 hypothetical protein CH92_04855 [Stutzerimonas stutzeri]MCQ4328979.1 hypothetical protein [Stutzerimonas stutzeri]